MKKVTPAVLIFILIILSQFRKKIDLGLNLQTGIYLFLLIVVVFALFKSAWKISGSIIWLYLIAFVCIIVFLLSII